MVSVGTYLRFRNCSRNPCNLRRNLRVPLDPSRMSHPSNQSWLKSIDRPNMVLSQHHTKKMVTPKDYKLFTFLLRIWAVLNVGFGSTRCYIWRSIKVWPQRLCCTQSPKNWESIRTTYTSPILGIHIIYGAIVEIPYRLVVCQPPYAHNHYWS